MKMILRWFQDRMERRSTFSPACTRREESLEKRMYRFQLNKVKRIFNAEAHRKGKGRLRIIDFRFEIYHLISLFLCVIADGSRLINHLFDFAAWAGEGAARRASPAGEGGR